MRKRVLLLEPNYKNKYPPMGLMKLATYHRLLGWDVVFYKGDLKDFVLTELTRDAIEELTKRDKSWRWNELFDDVKSCVKSGEWAEDSRIGFIALRSSVSDVLEKYHRAWKTDEYFAAPRWDRVCVTTLFTFYWKITIETIEFAKRIVKNQKQLMVGGVLATLVADELEAATGIKPYKGCILEPRLYSDRPVDRPIDELPLDYSILDEIDYQYPCQNAYYAYATRGCVNRCKFCAVPKLEPLYVAYIPLKKRIDETRARFGEQKDLLLLDNNVFASEKFDEIIEDIKSCGFAKGEKFIPTSIWRVLEGLLEEHWNDRASIRRVVKELDALASKLPGERSQQLYDYIYRHSLNSIWTATREAALNACRYVQAELAQFTRRLPRERVVDFNQGVDARLASEEKIKKLSEVSIRPLRVAFDDWRTRRFYVRTLLYAAKYGIKYASNYLLYNFEEKPIDLYRRLLLNVDLSSIIDVNIYSFPMKYHPISDPKWFANRDYLGKYWDRKAIRSIQCVLNSTRGKVGTNRNFFFAAFGRDEEAYAELLRMPEAFVLMRWDAEGSGATDRWREAWQRLDGDERILAKDLIAENRFDPKEWGQYSMRIQKYLRFYLTKVEDVKRISAKKKQALISNFEATLPTEISSELRDLLKEMQEITSTLDIASINFSDSDGQ